MELQDVVSAFGLDPNGRYSTRSKARVDCPFCGGKKTLSLADGRYKCWKPACVANRRGGPMNLYCLLQFGCRFDAMTKEQKAEARQEADAFDGVERVPAIAPKRVLEHKIASDGQLHKVYTAVLKQLSLSDKDKSELLERGLTELQIERNGYRSITEVPDDYIARSEAAQGFVRELLKSGLTSNDFIGVPGFYKGFMDQWTIRLISGMVIPVRNLSSQIVGLVIHDRTRDAKYMLLSSSGKNEGTGAVGRIHVPLGSSWAARKSNAFLEKRRVVVTEGVLKSDVAVGLCGEHLKYPIVGIQGVDNTARLPKLLKSLEAKELGDALDMDRCINPGVKRGSRKLATIADSCGMCYVAICWDRWEASRLAKQAFAMLSPEEQEKARQCCAKYQGKSIATWYALAYVCSKIENWKSIQWRSETKGIDDVLLLSHKIGKGLFTEGGGVLW